MKYNLNTDKFQGPIALLYDLIDQRKLSVSEFSLVEITQDFITYVKVLGERYFDKEETSNFISVASILILLKSKTLIPELELTQEEDRDIQVLENQLKSFEILKSRTKILKDVWGKKIPLNPKINYKNTDQIFAPSSQMDLNFFHKYVIDRLIEIIPKEDKKKEITVHKSLKIEDALSHVRQILKRIKNLSFKNLNSGGDERLREKNKRNVVILFLAVLELMKMGELDLEQKENFSDIIVTNSNL